MERIKKIALILLIWLMTIFFISLLQVAPISMSLNIASFFEIPFIFWIILLITPFLLYIIAKNSKNPFVPLLSVILYFFIFYAYGLYFWSHPTTTDIINAVRFQDILSSITHIGAEEIAIEKYFNFPIYFIFSKIFASVLGIGSIQTLNIGFFSSLLIIPIILTLFYNRNHIEKNVNIYFIPAALYLTLSWYFINDQFVPQFLGLIYLIILFGIYARYQKSSDPIFILLMVIFYALAVFTHPFIHIFFLIMIIFEKPLSKLLKLKEKKIVSNGVILSFLAVLIPYIGVYYLMLNVGTSETWLVFQRIVSEKSNIGLGYDPHPLYHLVPRIYDRIMSPISKYILYGAIFVVAIAFILYIIKKRRLYDFNVLTSSISWFVLGLTNLVMGQRALQVAMLPLSRHFTSTYRLFSILSKILIVVILITPFLFTANHMVNLSIGGDKYIQDPQENLMGRFAEKHITNETVIFKPLNPYPTSSYLSESGLTKTRIAFEESYSYNWILIDVVLDSPKIQKYFKYYNISLPVNIYDSIVYDNNDLHMII